MRIRLLAAVLAAVMSMTLFVGCNDNDDTTVTTTTEATTTTTEDVGTTTEEEETPTSADDETTTGGKKSTTKKTTVSTTQVTYRTVNKNTTTTVTTTSEKPIDNVTEPTSKGSTTTTKKTPPSRTKTTKKDWSHIFPVKVEKSAEERSASINNNLNGKQKVKIKSDRATVLMHDCKEYTFTHHPGIALKDGRLFVSFTQSFKDEDAPGQRVAVCYSDDFFTWSDPVVAAACAESALVPGKEAANIPRHFFAINGELLLFYGSISYGAECYDKLGQFKPTANASSIAGHEMFVRSKDGITWSEPERFGGAIAIPQKSLTDQWISYANWGVSWLEDGKEPNGLYWSDGGTLTPDQKSAAQIRAKQAGASLTEYSGYQSRDYVFHIMTRSETNKMWHHESYDNGQTWTDVYPTNFATTYSYWDFGNLPDGRVFAVGSSDVSKGRYPLEMWISEDGYNFNTCYILRDEYDIAETGDLFLKKGQNQHCAGWSKGGQYGYPHVVMDDTYMYVAYSRHKEMMEITRVKLSDI
ncbi:MAG: exo-alpha-sialidase [Clostridia bacterium]|nr:exo-alpha-sialidase [Clostridia bacterium]